MKSTEFLMEAEANLAKKKLDTYLDMLSDDNLRSLIPMLKKEVQLDEAVNPELYQRLAARKGQGSPIKVDSPKPVNKQPSSAPKTTADPEATKVQQTISSLSTAEKKELLSLLQKEAKTRPAAKKSAQKKNSDDKKSTGKGMMGCLLPLVGIVGLLSLIPDSPDSATVSSSSSSQSSGDFSMFKALSGDYLDSAKKQFCRIKQGWSTNSVLQQMSSGEQDFNDMFLKKELLTPNTEVWTYGAMNQIGTLYIDRDSNRVTSVIFGDISPDDCY